MSDTKVLMLKKYKKDGKVDVEPIVTIDNESGLSADALAYILNNETHNIIKLMNDNTVTATEYVVGDLKYYR